MDGEQQRLHRIRAEYSARRTAPKALDLERTDPCLVRDALRNYDIVPVIWGQRNSVRPELAA